MFTPINQDNKHLMVLCKVKYFEDNNEIGYKTLGPLRKVEFNDQELFCEYLISRLGILTDSYSSNSKSEIVFTYIIKSGEVSNEDRLLLDDMSDKDVTFHEFKKIKLPISMEAVDYGTIMSKSIVNGNTRFIVESNNRVYKIDVILNKFITNKVRLLGASGLEWTDTRISDDLIKREIGKTTFYFLDGEMVLAKKVFTAKPFTKSKH